MKICALIAGLVMMFVVTGSAGTASAAVAAVSIGQSCGADGNIAAQFIWTGSDSSAQQWLDLSLSNNGWPTGTFISAGPFTGNTSSFLWRGLLPGTQHFVRVNQLLPDGTWDPSDTFQFTTSVCAPGSASVATAGSLPAGWISHDIGELTIALPISFGASSSSAAASVPLTNLLQGSDVSVLLAATDQSHQGASVNVLRLGGSDFAGVSIDDVATEVEGTLRKAGFVIVDRSAVTLPVGPAIKHTIDVSAGTITLREVQYMFVLPSGFWIVTFAGLQTQFGDLGPVFDQSAQSIRTR